MATVAKTSKLHKVYMTIAIKHTVHSMKKVSNLFKCWACDQPEISLEGLHYHIKHYHNKRKHFELNMHVKSICDNGKKSFRTLKLLEDHTETKYQDHYAKAPTTTMQLKTFSFNACLTKIFSWGEDSW